MPRFDLTKPAGPPRASDSSDSSGASEHPAPDPAVLPPPGHAAAGLDDAAASEEPGQPGGPPTRYEAI